MALIDGLIAKYEPYRKNKYPRYSVIFGIVFLFASLVLAFFAIIYATDSASGPVTDLILSNIPVFDVDGLFVYGPTIFWIIVLAFLIFSVPERIPFSLKSIALFVVIRSVFISLTHIGPFPTHIQINPSGIFGVFTSGNDLFFSGHTGLPFLMAMIFWDKAKMRWFCFASSVFFGAVVLMGHLHYSIDVFAAFFITYAIFNMALHLFRRDYAFFAASRK